MYVNQRELDIVKFLIDNKQQEFISSKQMAEHLKVSERTVQRELKNVEGTLARFHIPLEKKVGYGVKISPDYQNEMERLKKDLFLSSQTEFSVEEKEELLLWVLLNSHEPMKVSALASILDSSTFVTSNVLANAEKTLASLQLALVKKRGSGIELIGNERDKRRVIMSIFTSNIDEYVFYEWVKKSDVSHLDLTRKQRTILNMMNLTISRVIKQYLDQEEKKLKSDLTGESYYRLMMMMIFTLERLEHHLYVDVYHVKRAKLFGTQELENAKRIFTQLHNMLHIDFTENELHYIANKLKHMKYRTSKGVIIEENLELNMQVRQLISHVFARLEIPEKDDKTFEMELLVHLQPSIHLLQSTTGKIENTSLEVIKQEYQELFHIIREEVDNIWVNLHMPDEEIAYLVLHFGAYLLKHRSIKEFHVLIVCTHGIGSSKMLASTLKSKFSSIKSIDTVSFFNFENIAIEPYDLILSTIPIEVEDMPIIKVHSLLTNTDLKKIEAFLHEKAVDEPDRSLTKEKKEVPQESTMKLEQFHDIQQRMTTFSSILHSFQVKVLTQEYEGEAMMAPLRDICEQLSEEGFLHNPKLILQKIIDREAMGKIAIPDSNVVFFHVRDNDIKQPFFKQFVLEKTIPYEATDGSMIAVQNIFIMMAPIELNQYERECLSTTSASLIESDYSIQLFSSSNESQIKDYLANKYKQFIMNEDV